MGLFGELAESILSRLFRGMHERQTRSSQYRNVVGNGITDEMILATLVIADPCKIYNAAEADTLYLDAAMEIRQGLAVTPRLGLVEMTTLVERACKRVHGCVVDESRAREVARRLSHRQATRSAD